MFYREIIENLNNQAERKSRKPLILRGAQQVGKTMAVEMFSKHFDQYISFNLEKAEDRILFEKQYTFPDLLMAIFVYARIDRHGGRTLLFIDEIQHSPKAGSVVTVF